MKSKILFVCLGNICRSPAAEGVFEYLVRECGQENSIEIDSAGTYGGHAGAKPDHRMRQAAAKRGYDLTSRSRQVTTEDFHRFDMILAMDRENYMALQRMAPDEQSKRKVHYLTEFGSPGTLDYVPDPYYGGADGFELVLDMLEDCCKGLLDRILQKKGQ